MIVAGVDLSARVLVFYRLALAALTIVLGLALARRLVLLRVDEGRTSLVWIGVTLAFHWFLFFETIKLSSVAVAVLTVYTAPLFLAVLAPLLLPERRSRVALAALVPASGGLALMALAGEGTGHLRPLALGTGLAAALTYAVLIVSTKRLAARVPVVTIAFWSYLVAALALAPTLLGGVRVVPRLGEAGLLLVLGCVFTALSGVLYIGLLRRVTAQTIGVLAYIEPVSAAVLAWAILGEKLGWPVLAGGALVVAAGAAVALLEPGDDAPVEVPRRLEPRPGATRMRA